MLSLASAAALTFALSVAVRFSAWSWFALTMACILPPPRCMKMSGAEFELSAVCTGKRQEAVIDLQCDLGHH